MTASLAQREFVFGKADLQFIIALVAEKTGIVLAEHKEDMIYSRIARRLRHLQLHSFRDYCNMLQHGNNTDELVHFVNALTTNMTSFYREAHHFTHLREAVLQPKMADPAARKRLRLWSAACSSGAEAYSMAFTCLELMELYLDWDIKILATDIDTVMLDKARNGIYSQQELSGIPPALLKKYTRPHGTGDQYIISDNAKHLITFNQLNLIQNWPFNGPFDAVFCRNVIIYFNKATQRELFSRMANYVLVGDWLYLGHSESLHGVNTDFQLRGKTIYQRGAE